MPSYGCRLQDIVVHIFGLFNLRFQTDITPDYKAALIKQQCRQKAAHSAVSIVEWMDAEKIIDKYWYQDQRIDSSVINCLAEARADFRHRFRGLVWRKWGEPCPCVSVCMGFSDIVLNVFEPTTDLAPRVAIKHAMKLQNIIWCDRDVLMILMNGV
ncbi:hypothetical protein SDC9_126324 [bioreactor metagenome]|uniref:Uncharacterized protein n=1 Tax=bioreactor metagenome TaxID=1076179 RepID=A0A645CQU1_9ZZZZ